MTLRCCKPIMLGMAICLARTAAAADDNRWWPQQILPKGAVGTKEPARFPEPAEAYHMLVQSVAGLAAQAVNEGRGDELVWIGVHSTDAEDWCNRWLQRHQVEDRGVFEPWDLVERFAKRGIVKGYILYNFDQSPGELNIFRPNSNCSVNVATSAAGLLGGVLVDRRLQAEAEARGLTQLLDARDKTQAWCVETYRGRLNRRMLCLQDPRKPQIRDLAIAHKVLTLYGKEPCVAAALRWIEPLSPILGWPGENDRRSLRLTSVYGHVQTASDLCLNLPVTMAGSGPPAVARLPSVDPRTIDWKDRRNGMCFVSSHGYNLQLLQTSFFRGSSDFWGHPDRGQMPFGWSCCLAQLEQVCPLALDYAVATRKPNDSLIEWGGGHFLLDVFAQERADRWQLVAQQARRTWAWMRNCQARTIGFEMLNLESDDARQALQTFAAQTDGLLAIFAIEQNAAQAGAGKTLWVKDRRGVEIPVITARYLIRGHHDGPRAGTPAKIAHEIAETVSRTPADQLPRYDWTLVHIWSYFRHAPGDDEQAENVVQSEAREQAAGAATDSAATRGYAPALWCAARLPATIRVMSPEELAWRIRMQHDPQQTRRAVERGEP